MTCEQARKLYDEDPFAMPTATFDATTHHLGTCQACQDYLEERCAEDDKFMTDEDRAECHAAALRLLDDSDRRRLTESN